MPGENEVPQARAYCREMLPRVSRTFALNIRLLDVSMGEAVRIGYLLCRIADTIEDAWPGPRAGIEARFDDFLAAMAGDRDAAAHLSVSAAGLRGLASDAHVELVGATPIVLKAYTSLDDADRTDIAEAVRTMSLGMRHYAGRAAERAPAGSAATAGAGGGSRVARVPYLDDDAELTHYCWIVAGCVGVMLTRLFTRRCAGTNARRLELSPIVGEALQLTNILLDWPVDLRSGRCHVPASWLNEFGLGPADLVGPARPEVEALARRLEALAWQALACVPEYMATIPSRHPRYRMFCLWPALWAAASLRHARRDPGFPWGPARPRLPRAELRNVAIAALLRGHSAGGVERLFREVGVETLRPAR